ncbi:MAG: hypothetical protein ACE5G1_05360, partial [bacterium]
MKKLCYLAVGLLLPVQLLAQSVNARFSTSFYSWERNLTESQSQSYVRIYQTAQATVGQLASNRLSFHLYGLLSQDLSESADDDPISRLYNAYFQWRQSSGVVQQIKLGRQRIYSGVAYGTIDGIDATFKIGKWARIGGFAGFLVPASNEIEVADWDNSHAFGVRASTNDLFGAKAMVSFMQRDRRPVAYNAPGRYTQTVRTFESLEQRLLGIDLYRGFGKTLSTYGRFDYDLEQERVRRAQVELKVKPTGKWEFTGEFFHRAPLIEANSIFSVFEQNTVQDVGLKASYKFGHRWFLTGNLGYVKYEGDETVRFGLGARFRYGYAGYNYRSGYGGQNNGVYLALNYPLTQQLGLIASSGFSRYSLFDENADKYTS